MTGTTPSRITGARGTTTGLSAGDGRNRECARAAQQPAAPVMNSLLVPPPLRAYQRSACGARGPTRFDTSHPFSLLEPLY
jgi:hypothetical protein